MVFLTLMFGVASPLLADKQPTGRTHVRVGLASLRRVEDIDGAVVKMTKTLKECGERHVEIVCFPETYLPGLRGADKDVPPVDQPAMERAVEQIAKACRANTVAAIIGVEWLTERGLENRAIVIGRDGTVLGHQTKNQITPGGESKNYVPDGKRQMFDVDGVRFGISICHEGWRYPETVRWAAVRGAQIVFQPQVTGSDHLDPAPPARWGESFYEKAMQCRAEENSVYFVSVNRAMKRQNSASSVIDPKGDLVEFIPRGEEKLLVVDLELTNATGFYASRFQPNLYNEQDQVALAKAPNSRPVNNQSAQRLKTTIPVQLDYLLYLPPDYKKQDKWPLLLFLHGAGERGDDIELVKIHGPPKLIAEGKDFPFIVVSPQSPKNRWWRPHELTALLDDIADRYKVDEDRVYCTGLSMGGFGTWSLAFYAPDRFAALVPICGGGETYWAKQLAHVPVWAFHGAKDTGVPPARSEQMVEALKKANGNVKLTVYPEAGHDSWTETYNNPNLYKWLLQQRRIKPASNP